MGYRLAGRSGESVLSGPAVELFDDFVRQVKTDAVLSFAGLFADVDGFRFDWVKCRSCRLVEGSFHLV